MNTPKTLRIVCLLLVLAFLPLKLRAEFEEDPNIQEEKQENTSLRNSQKTQTTQGNGNHSKSSQSESSHSSWSQSSRYKKEGDKRKYFNDEEKRIDAGVFHVGFGAGGNFYTEPKFNKTSGIPLGEYFKD